MAYLDIINCIFEFISAFVIWLSVWQVWRDRGSKGIHWAQATFFSLESIWNLHYYNTLGQQFSLLAGVFVFAGNLAWVWLAFVWFRSPRVSFYTALLVSCVVPFLSKLLKSLKSL